MFSNRVHNGFSSFISFYNGRGWHYHRHVSFLHHVFEQDEQCLFPNIISGTLGTTRTTSVSVLQDAQYHARDNSFCLRLWQYRVHTTFRSFSNSNSMVDRTVFRTITYKVRSRYDQVLCLNALYKSITIFLLGCCANRLCQFCNKCWTTNWRADDGTLRSISMDATSYVHILIFIFVRELGLFAKQTLRSLKDVTSLYRDLLHWTTTCSRRYTGSGTRLYFSFAILRTRGHC